MRRMKEKSPSLSVAHIDHDVAWRDLVRRIVRRLPGFKFTESFPNAFVAWRLSLRPPDILIIDFSSLDADGLDFVVRFAESNRRTKVLALTSRCDDLMLYRIQHSRV